MLEKKMLLPTKFSSTNLIARNNLILKLVNINAIFSLTENINEKNKFNQNFKVFFSLDIPDIGKFTFNNKFMAIWLRTNSYFVLGEENFDNIISSFESVASITDQTGGWVKLNIDGEKVKFLLEKLLTIDLKVFYEGSALRTSINKINCIVLCNKQFKNYTILCPVSFFESMKIRLTNLVNLIA